MLKLNRVMRDPNPTESGEVTPPVTPPVQAPAQPPLPKTKDDWDKLSKEDPQRWISLTQARMDQVIRQGRETQEKLNQKQKIKENLAAELENIKKVQRPLDQDQDTFNQSKPFGRDNMPRTKEQWDTLWIEDPNLASDLRHFKNQSDFEVQQRQTVAQTEYAKARKESAKVLWDRHPDMYVQETDSEGNVKLDGNGKPVLKLDPNTSAPMLNLESEKGKIFVQVYSEDVNGYDGAKYAARLVMAEMERRLQEQGNQQIENAGKGNQPQGSQTAAPDQRGTMPGGVNPPATGKVSFSSDEEKTHATKAVQRGVYKNIEEYCQLRDGKNTGIYDENRVPDFSKK